MKHLRFLILLVIFILLLGFYVQQNSLLFVYVNPQTDTSGMKYSAKTIMEIGHVLDKARMTSRRDHVKYNYEYYNPYGSGFLPHNPIPNDLDLEVGINLGEFTYDGNNGEKVAQDILNAIENFSFAFNFCLNSDSKNLYTDISPFDLLENMTKVHKRYKRALKESLDYVVSVLVRYL
ncbi:MAG: hypothetical protein II085_03130 [Alphaproteobacteria bacterium]|nr:hypothetical protein [Alphaproteobacteria bacterium]